MKIKIRDGRKLYRIRRIDAKPTLVNREVNLINRKTNLATVVVDEKIHQVEILKIKSNSQLFKLTLQN